MLFNWTIFCDANVGIKSGSEVKLTDMQLERFSFFSPPPLFVCRPSQESAAQSASSEEKAAGEIAEKMGTEAARLSVLMSEICASSSLKGTSS